MKKPAMKQMSFGSAEYAGKKRVTRRKKFLGEIAQVVPWNRLEAVIEPHYPKSAHPLLCS
jgi:IS5 family transposase